MLQGFLFPGVYICNMQISHLYKIYQQYPSVQTDTRKLKPGDIFFALKGNNFNGNTFSKQAIVSGASYSVIDEAAYEIPGKTILVDDVLDTLQQLAKYHRQQFKNLSRPFGIPFIAITGSNGKTTTKELIHAVLSTTYKTYTTEGNLNNHIGVPLTILKIKSDAEIAVIEMGANHQKEIESYCKYALPTHGLITNCGKAHLEGFINEAGVRKGKGELFDYLRANNGTAFIMNDYEYLLEMSQGISQIIKYGSCLPVGKAVNADIEGIAINNETQLAVEITKGSFTGKIKTQLVGDFNLPNVLAAVTVGVYFKVPAEKIKSAIENYVPSNSRSQLIEKGTNKIILDAYNANPSSMKLAIENFAKVKDGKKILILGAMAELGKESEHEHQQIISLIRKYNWDEVLLVGENFNNLNHPYKKFSSSNDAKEWFKNQHFQNTFFLVKGSRSTQMEKIVE